LIFIVAFNRFLALDERALVKFGYLCAGMQVFQAMKKRCIPGMPFLK